MSPDLDRIENQILVFATLVTRSPVLGMYIGCVSVKKHKNKPQQLLFCSDIALSYDLVLRNPETGSLSLHRGHQAITE